MQFFARNPKIQSELKLDVNWPTYGHLKCPSRSFSTKKVRFLVRNLTTAANGAVSLFLFENRVNELLNNRFWLIHLFYYIKYWIYYTKCCQKLNSSITLFPCFVVWFKHRFWNTSDLTSLFYLLLIKICFKIFN